MNLPRHILFAMLLVCAMAVQTMAAENIRVYFSPGTECAAALVEEVNHARESVQVLIYQLTDRAIAEAFAQAHQRGVRVAVVVDKSMRKSRDSQVGALIAAGVPVAVDERHAIMHNKVVIIDGQTVVTGSYNFSNSARKRNAENMVIITDRAVAERFADNFAAHLAHSVNP